MINFLNPKLLPKLTCTPPCTENYEADNLISRSNSDKLRGFIAYPAKKPPVELEFEFLCNVNISYIFLNTSVGNQRCSGIEIFVKNDDSPYVSIGRAIYDAQGIVFCNNRKYSKSTPPSCCHANIALYFFKNGTFKSFLNASSVKILIFRTEKSVPCLAAVEVWGLPAKSCSQKTVDTVHRLAGQNDRSESTVTGTVVSKTIPCKTPSGSDRKDTFRIPDEFKDELTYELMTIPYTLPSGKTIDKATLEKHIASEKSFGRKPGDPFTGVKFTDVLKPVLNVGLKSRIDMFLLENSHRVETFNLKRTLRVENNVNKRPKKDNNSEICGLVYNSSNPSSEDLDFLIDRAKSASNFLSFTPSRDSSRNICILCKNPSDYLYELPCEHCYCRKCLLDICKNCICVECKQQFVKSEVRKIDV